MSSDDSDNLVLRHLEELRKEMREGFDEVGVRLTRVAAQSTSLLEKAMELAELAERKQPTDKETGR